MYFPEEERLTMFSLSSLVLVSQVYVILGETDLSHSGF